MSQVKLTLPDFGHIDLPQRHEVHTLLLGTTRGCIQFADKTGVIHLELLPDDAVEFAQAEFDFLVVLLGQPLLDLLVFLVFLLSFVDFARESLFALVRVPFGNNDFVLGLLHVLAVTLLVRTNVAQVAAALEAAAQTVAHVLVLVELRKHLHVLALGGLEDELALPAGVLVLPEALLVLLVGALVLDAPAVLVVVFEVAFLPVPVGVDVLALGVLFPVLPEADLEVVFGPVVESKAVAVEVLLDGLLLVPMVPLEYVETVPASVLEVAQGLLDVGSVLAHDDLLAEAKQVVILELADILVFYRFGLRVQVDQLAHPVQLVVPEGAHEDLVVLDRHLHAPAVQLLVLDVSDDLALLLVDDLVQVLLVQLALQLLRGTLLKKLGEVLKRHL